MSERRKQNNNAKEKKIEKTETKNKLDKADVLKSCPLREREKMHMHTCIPFDFYKNEQRSIISVMIYKCLFIFLLRYAIANQNSFDKISCFQPNIELRNTANSIRFFACRSIKAIWKICPTTTNLEAQMEFEKFYQTLSNNSSQVKQFFLCIQMISFFLFVLSNGMDLAQKSKIETKSISHKPMFEYWHRRDNHIQSIHSEASGFKISSHSRLMRFFWQSLSCYLNICRHSFAQMNNVKWFGSLHLNIPSVQRWRLNVWLNHKPTLMTEQKIAITQNNVDWNLWNRCPQPMGAGGRFVWNWKFSQSNDSADFDEFSNSTFKNGNSPFRK